MRLSIDFNEVVLRKLRYLRMSDLIDYVSRLDIGDDVDVYFDVYDGEGCRMRIMSGDKCLDYLVLSYKDGVLLTFSLNK